MCICNAPQTPECEHHWQRAGQHVRLDEADSRKGKETGRSEENVTGRL